MPKKRPHHYPHKSLAESSQRSFWVNNNNRIVFLDEPQRLDMLLVKGAERAKTEEVQNLKDPLI